MTHTTAELTPIGRWRAEASPPAFSSTDILSATLRVREPAQVVREGHNGRVGVAFGGEHLPLGYGDESCLPLLATLPGLYPEWLGDRSFCEVHRTRFAYVAGEMANGISTTDMVIAMARRRMLGFFGAAGLRFERVASAVEKLSETLGEGASWGVNLIHSPNETSLENRVADMLIARGVERISASAFMALTPAVVRCSVAGLSADPSGKITRKHHIFAKISRPEVAARFMAPAPIELLRGLLAEGRITEEEARLAERVPVAEDLTVEADSGGHTDNQALTALLPSILALRDEIAEKHGYSMPIRVGAAGGLGTPSAVAAAFTLGAAYVVTGSINQAAVESGLSEAGKAMLARADIADVTMAPAADMFELGVKVQVLKRATLFGPRAARLYEAYTQHSGIEALPPELRGRLEREVLHASLDDIWVETRRFWERRDPQEIARAERDPKHQMALVFRWYLGSASKWAIDGTPERATDYQIWCGPAMGAFNRWTAGSFLSEPSRRTVAQIALNLMEGAAVITRAQQLRSAGVPVSGRAFSVRPRLFE